MDPLDFFAKTVAEFADNGQWTPEKYKRMLDEIFAAVRDVPGAKIVIMFQHGDNVALLGLKDGELIGTNAGFRSVLAPVFERL